MSMSSKVNCRQKSAQNRNSYAQLVQFVGHGMGFFDPAAALLRPVLVGVFVVEPDEDGLVDGHRLQVNERASQRDEHNFFVGRRIDAAVFLGVSSFWKALRRLMRRLLSPVCDGLLRSLFRCLS